MPYSPPLVRGRCYSSPSYARCPEYKMCRRCRMCANYNQHNAMCVVCESVKTGRKHECTFDQLIGLNEIELKLGRPIFEANQDPSQVITEKVMSTAYDDELSKLVRQVG